MRRTAGFAALAACGALALVRCSQGQEHTPAAWDFVRARGDELVLDERPFRFVSFNIPNLHLVEDNFAPDAVTPWAWPTEFEIRDALTSIRQLGGQVVRTYVLSVRREGADIGDFVFVRGPGEFNEEAFQSLDAVLAIAREQQVRLIIPLVDNWTWWGGRGEYAAFRGKQSDDFWTDPQLIDDFCQTIRYVLNRVNTRTGVRYKDDPTILGWETGNELDSPESWTRQIAACLKREGAQQLVIDGNSLRGLQPHSLEIPEVDVVTTHHYPGENTDFVADIRRAKALARGKKPYFVGEFGFVEPQEVARVLDAVVEHDVSGALLWSLRYRHRDGGFYWHSEPSGGGLHKAYHWPGFAEGERYGERRIVATVRSRAYVIRGLAPPPLDAPAPPRLLPIVDQGRVAWQGSAGAESYRVERAEDPAGPWSRVAEGVSDAQVQYAPLWADEEAEPGQTYYYRVTAIGPGGASPPSEPSAAVLIRARALVDEGANLERLAAHTADVTTVGGGDRQRREDIHRLRLPLRASITYRTRGPLADWHVTAFRDGAGVTLRASGSVDGETFVPLPHRELPETAAANDYGYLPRIRALAADVPADVRWLRLEAQPTAEEADAAAPPPALEIGRVELRYDALLGAAAPPEGCPLEPSVLLFHKRHHPSGADQVHAAADLGFRRVNVIATLQSRIDAERRVTSLGTFAGGGRGPLDEASLKAFRAALTATFAAARERNVELAVTCHLNAWGPIDDWRNYFRFDPLARYEGWSYREAMIESVATALHAAGYEGPVELALLGEMGQTLFEHPSAYREIVGELRADSRLPQLQIGVSLNFDKVSGHHEPTDAQWEAVGQLLEECDFLGVSNYRWADLPIGPDDFAAAIESLRSQLDHPGVTAHRTLPLHFTEIGLGGCRDHGVPARSPEEAIKTPWLGTTAAEWSPWSNPKLRAVRREYHAALLEFLRDPPPGIVMTGAYLWTEGSWDPLDLIDRGFLDADLVRQIRAHNAAVRAGAKSSP